MPRLTSKPETQRAALALLAYGWLPSEVAKVAGVSAQLVYQWGKSARIDWQRIRDGRLIEHWERALKRKPRTLPSKRRLRSIAAKAKREWDRRHAENP